MVNDYTLQVTIDAPKSYFLSKLTYPTAMVVDKANVAAGKNWWQKPNGTGPFQSQGVAGEQLCSSWRGMIITMARKASVQEVQFLLWGGSP